MKLNESSATSNSNFTEKQRITATIDNPVKILRMFTKDLYKKPLQTAIQEYINNAKDAHTMANKDTSSIEIIAPTMANQNVIIKDYGVGLSQDDIINVFSRITASNKDHSNLFNGGFGIGSKSWFAVNPNFFVTSTFNGKRSYYEISFTDNIYIDLLDEEECDEINGVEVSLPLANKEQIKESHAAIKRAIRFWSKRPKLFNLEMKPLEFIYENETFRLLSLDNTGEPLIVTLGETQYSINDFDHLPDFFKYTQNCSIELKLKVGEFQLKNGQEVGPDRENFVLEMEEKILQKYNAVANYIPLMLQDLITKTDDLQLIHSILKTPCVKMSTYNFTYRGLDVQLSSRHSEATPSILKYKGIWNWHSQSESYLQLSKKFMIIITGKNKHIKSNYRFISKEVCDKNSKLKGIYFTETLSGTEKTLLQEFVEIKRFKELNIKLPEEKTVKKNESVTVLEHMHFDAGNGNSPYKRKMKVSQLDKKIKIISESHANSKLPNEDITLMHKIQILKKPYTLVPDRVIDILLKNKFKEFDIPSLIKEYNSHLKKSEIKAEKERQALVAVAKTEKIQNRLQWYNLINFLELLEENRYLKIGKSELQYNLHEVFNNELTKEFYELNIEKFRRINDLKNKFSAVLPFTEENFPQKEQHIDFIENLIDNHPLLWRGISSHSFNEFKEELKILAKNIK